MRLFEAILDANHRALAGDSNAGLHPGDFADELPIVALTCIDPRLNKLFPAVLAVPEEHFIWLRNAGNIITGPLSSTMRSLALACAVKGGKEIAIIGHTDCLVGKTTTMQLLDKLREAGVERQLLPANINEFFGIFSSERANIIKSVEFVRQSPLIGHKIPVHGLLVDTASGKLEWLVNGYQQLELMGNRWNELVKSAGQTVDALKPLTDFQIGEMKFPETKIGEIVTKAEDWLSLKVREMEQRPATANPPTPATNPPPPIAPPPPPKIPLPPPLRPKMHLRRNPKG
jgi:carbonic anhydrase